jgi:hypothetical protein
MTQFNQYITAQFILRSILILSCYLRLCFFHVHKFLHACYIYQFCDSFWCGILIQSNEVCSTWNYHEKMCMWPERRKERSNEKRKSFELISGLNFEPGSNRNATWSGRSITLNLALCDLHTLHIRTVCAVHTWLWVVHGLQFWGIMASVEFIHHPI